MKAFLQWKRCHRCGETHTFGIVRSGPDAKHWGDPWDGICFIDNAESVVLIEGYVGRGKYTRARREAIVDVIRLETGKEAKWVRRKRGTAPRHVVTNRPRRLKYGKNVKNADRGEGGRHGDA